MLRASGISWDMRKNYPYELYNNLNFSIPLAHTGDCYDRYLIRMFEMRQSINIIQQCLGLIKPGLIQIDNFKIVPPARFFIKNSMEALINHFILYTEGFPVTPGYNYSSTETPKGELGVFLVANNSPYIYRCKIRSPSFFHLQALNTFSRGYFIADVVALIGSMDIVFGEVDR